MSALSINDGTKDCSVDAKGEGEMESNRKTISILSDERRFVSQKFAMLLDDLIWHVESQDFDSKIFSELYLDLLSCAAHIFELEKRSYGLKDKGTLTQSAIPYQAFRAQLARLNDRCRERGIGHSHSMLEFLLDWFSKRYEVSNMELKNRNTETDFAFAC